MPAHTPTLKIAAIADSVDRRGVRGGLFRRRHSVRHQGGVALTSIPKANGML
jgi:hypothetical protein